MDLIIFVGLVWLARGFVRQTNGRWTYNWAPRLPRDCMLFWTYLGVYSLGTLPQQDLASIPGALASNTVTTDLGVYGRWTVEVTAPSPQDGRLTVDDIQWPAARGPSSTSPAPAGEPWTRRRSGRRRRRRP